MFDKDKIFVVGSKIINSCITMEQLDNAKRAITLIRNINDDDELINNLYHCAQQRKTQIEKIENINVNYTEVKKED